MPPLGRTIKDRPLSKTRSHGQAYRSQSKAPDDTECLAIGSSDNAIDRTSGALDYTL
jgi:hypothetical protein